MLLPIRPVAPCRAIPRGEGATTSADILKKVLYAIEPGVRFRAVFLSAPLKRLLEFLQDFALAFAEVNWCFNYNSDQQVARTMASDGFHTLASDLERLVRLGALGHFEANRTRQGWQLQVATEGGLSEGNWNLTEKIVTITLKNGVLPDLNFNVQVTRWSATNARFTLTRKPDSVATVNAWWD